jgi:hypothetical protein
MTNAMAEREIVEIPIHEAEALTGKRLDRRRKYAAWNDRSEDEHSGAKVFALVRWTDLCTGCTEHGEYGTQYGPFGCSECGHTGKRRHAMWVPEKFLALSLGKESTQ